jgi:hypothetical protein
MYDKLELPVMDLNGATAWQNGGQGFGRTLTVELGRSSLIELTLSHPDGLLINCLLDHRMASRLMIRLGACLEDM